MTRCKGVLGAWVLALAGLMIAADVGAAQQVAHDRIVVRGVLTPGPRLWTVSDADTEIYVLTLPTFLQDGVEWDDGAVRSVLEEADLVISDFDLTYSPGDRARIANFMGQTLLFRRGRINMRRGHRLDDAIGAALAARFQEAWAEAEAASEARDRADGPGLIEVGGPAIAEALSDVHDKRMHPLFQAARMQEAATAGAGLVHNEEVLDQVRRLARRAGVPRESTSQYDLHIADVKTVVREARNLSRGLNEICIAEALAFATEDVPLHATASDAWARGDVATLRASAPEVPERRGCLLGLEAHMGGLDTLDGRASAEFVDRDIWFDRLVAELERPGVRLAVVSAQSWLAPETGVMDQLQAAGVTVAGP